MTKAFTLKSSDGAIQPFAAYTEAGLWNLLASMTILTIEQIKDQFKDFTVVEVNLIEASTDVSPIVEHDPT